MPVRFTYVDNVCSCSLFSLLYSIPWHAFMTFYPVIIDGHLECFWFGAIKKNAAVAEDASYLLKCTLSFFLGTQLDFISQSPL